MKCEHCKWWEQGVCHYWPECIETGPTHWCAQFAGKPKAKVGNSLDGFARWWNLYPRKVGKQDTMKVWKSRNLADKTEELVNKLTAQRETDDKWKQGFIPNPATYLRQARWEDEIQKSNKVDRDKTYDDARPGETWEQYERRKMR